MMCKYACIDICIHKSANEEMNTCTRVYVYTRIRVYLYIYIFIYEYMHISIHVDVCMCVFFVHTYVCIDV